MPVMTAPALPLTATQRAELKRLAMSTSLPHRQVLQAKALLWAGDGVANQEIDASTQFLQAMRPRAGGGRWPSGSTAPARALAVSHVLNERSWTAATASDGRCCAEIQQCNAASGPSVNWWRGGRRALVVSAI